MAVSGDGILVFSIGRRVIEERGLNRVGRGGSKEASGGGDGAVKSEEESSEEVQNRNTEKF